MADKVKIYLTYSDIYGEMEGMYSEDGVLLGSWSCDDASWREYFNPFMKRLGIEVYDHGPTPFDEKFEHFIRETYDVE